MELTLGPVLFDWGKERLVEFYREAAEWPVSDIYIGEVVCARRKGLLMEDLEKTAEFLCRAGKNVIISTPALVSNDEELDYVRALCDLPFPIEANDVSALQIRRGKKHTVAGPHITSYNYPTVNFLRASGIRRVVFPVELPSESMSAIIKNTDIETEVFGYGKLPLAFSWRCYTARRSGNLKSKCKYECRSFPDGIMVDTLEKKPFLIINGCQIMSALTMNLIHHIDELKQMGTSKFRISPQGHHTSEIVSIFHERLCGSISTDKAQERLSLLEKTGFCDGWYHKTAGWEFA